jgi:cytoskeleton protein RodZ
MPSLGQILLKARTERRLDLSEIARRIKINPKYLRAIEADEPKNVPGGFFYKSFVRQYAEALGVDSDEIEEALGTVEISEAPLPMPRQDDAILRDIRPMPEPGRTSLGGRMLPSLGILVVVLIACSAFYTWWRRVQAASAAKSAEVSTVLPASAPKHNTVMAPASPAPANPQQVAAAQPNNNPPPAPAAQTPSQPAPAPDQAAQSGDSVHLTLAATEDTWVQVSADGKHVFSGVLKGQETRNIEGKENTRVLIGNAGGLQIEWNGRPLGTLGKRGEVRDVLFTRDGYQVIQKAPKTDETPKSDQPLETQPT